MPSRRRVLAGSGVALAGLVGGGRVLVGGSRSSQPGLSAARPTEFDWPMARYDAAGTGFNPAASGPRDDVRVKWKREPEATVSTTAPPILVADGVVYLGYDWLNELVAIDAETGARRWTYETDRIGFSQPIVGDGVLYVVETDGVVALEEGP